MTSHLKLIGTIYYLSTLSLIYLLITYPQSWSIFKNRSHYSIKSFENYSIVVSLNSTSEDCYRIMSYEDALDRLKFVNEIHTSLVVTLATIDWIILFIGGVTSTILWAESRSLPSSGLMRKHSICEGITLISLLIFSPLSYPAIIDEYPECLDDNYLMKYNIYVGVFYVICSTIAVALFLVVLWLAGHVKGLFGKIFMIKLAFLISMLLIISVWITYNTSSWISLGITVIETIVALYTIYEDYIYTLENIGT